MTIEEKKERIVEMEWLFFQQVHNEGGRAACQNDAPTFFLMRRSQFAPWPEALVDSYLQDLEDAAGQGRNPLAEKYAWMMEHTAPEAFARLRDQLPPLTENTRADIRAIVAIHLQWMADYRAKYPRLSANNRAATSAEDTATDTSFETYLEGELKTYSPRTLHLYLAFMHDLQAQGQNLALLTMETTVKGYGHASLDDAEQRLARG